MHYHHTKYKFVIRGQGTSHSFLSETSLCYLHIPSLLKMTEPLSATASVLTLIAACTKIGQYIVNLIRTLHSAPLELVLLSNEVTDLDAALNELQPCIFGGCWQM